jgi:hypothetical protein
MNYNNHECKIIIIKKKGTIKLLKKPNVKRQIVIPNVKGHEDGRKQTSVAVVLDGRHTVRERWGSSPTPKIGLIIYQTS